MTCKDCFYYEDMCKEHLTECAEHGEAERILNPCSKFKNKADFVEVVRCAECLHYDFQHHQCDNPLGLWSTYMDKFCCYGERKKS